MHELERLYKLSGTGISATRKRPRSEPNRPPALPGDTGPEGRWETFQRIRTNRQGRLRIKIRKRRSDEMCPICSGHPHRTQEEINMHVERCVRKNSAMTDEDETVDVEGDSELEEWHETQRRRMNSLIEGMTNAVAQTPSSTRMTTTTEVSEEGENDGDDVIVDGDEPEVATVNSSMDVEVKVESGDSSNKKTSSSNSNSQQQQQCDSNVSTSDAEPSSRAQMIEELKNRIKQLEAEGGGGTDTTTTTNDSNEEYKCLICLEHYKKPVISTVCWHVHCEECWLHTLGSKKVCPQCSMITAPTDLRRIFM
ncbi:unnamed protein product [Callosobruchus maculatus]|uniref:RING-type domain-containing protein n=1 Tax=Callosobruchus maculatus TaxID=64391 RepID=A0A653DN69_CALMS|nr:unnamed protein product [Callosobruchus maculatus]